MLIAGLIGVNLVLALLAVWAIRQLRSHDPSRVRGTEIADAPAHGAALNALVDRAMFAFDSRRITADQH